MTTQIRTAAVFASTALATVITALVLSTTTSSQAQVSPSVQQLPRVVITGKVVRPAAAPAVIELPRVVVTGHVQPVLTAGVIELPRVVVTGRKVDSDAAVLAQASARSGGV
jgi:hypothetical protein